MEGGGEGDNYPTFYYETSSPDEAMNEVFKSRDGGVRCEVMMWCGVWWCGVVWCLHMRARCEVWAVLD